VEQAVAGVVRREHVEVCVLVDVGDEHVPRLGEDRIRNGRRPTTRAIGYEHIQEIGTRGGGQDDEVEVAVFVEAAAVDGSREVIEPKNRSGA